MRILQKNLSSMFGRAEMRDNQRTLVYRWEATCSRRLVRLAEDSGEVLSTKHCHYSSEFETLQECADFLRPIWTSERGRYGHARTPPPAVIRPHRGQRRALAKHTHELSLPKWSRNRWVILHEATHRLNVGYEAHGPRFVGILIGLLSRHAGYDANELMARADEMGVKYHVRSIGTVPVPSLSQRLQRLLPITEMDAAFELEVSWRQVRGAALPLIRKGCARWKKHTLVPA